MRELEADELLVGHFDQRAGSRRPAEEVDTAAIDHVLDDALVGLGAGHAE